MNSIYGNFTPPWVPSRTIYPPARIPLPAHVSAKKDHIPKSASVVGVEKGFRSASRRARNFLARGSSLLSPLSEDTPEHQLALLWGARPETAEELPHRGLPSCEERCSLPLQLFGRLETMQSSHNEDEACVGWTSPGFRDRRGADGKNLFTVRRDHIRANEGRQ